VARSASSHPAINGEGHPAINTYFHKAALASAQRNIRFRGDPGNAPSLAVRRRHRRHSNPQLPLSKD
jgi:hypothetical protein